MKKYEKGRDKEMERLKMCNAEAMKLIKDLEEEKKLLIYNEDNRATVSYKEGEAKPAPTYHYKETRERIAALDERIRKIKFELAKSNCAVQVEGFDMTIAEALVYLAQLRKEYEQLDELTERSQIARRITPTGVIEYTECLYDVKMAEDDMRKLKSKIGKLQVAIDRANLLNEICV